MTDKLPLLVQALNGLEKFEGLDEVQWSLVIRQARHAMLLGHVYYRLENNGLLNTIPPAALKHLNSGKVHADKQLNDLHWEIKHLKEVATGLDFSFVLLKGSAYAITNHPASLGRIFSDIDLLVAKENINIAEKNLMLKGWIAGNKNEYDQKYYRQWMHEIPPLVHIFRRSIIDLHHNILPETTKASPDASQLIKQAVNIDNEENIKVLCYEDRVIHSATHLFYDGEFEHGLRDLVDLDAFIRHQKNPEEMEMRILKRALFLGLQRPVFYAFRYLKLILNTPISKAAITQSEQNAKPNMVLLKVMDFLFFRALMPDHPSCNDAWTGFSRWIVYLRAHSLRMPLYLLIPHLFKKSLMRLTEKQT